VQTRVGRRAGQDLNLKQPALILLF
jgi:hypothetical protein